MLDDTPSLTNPLRLLAPLLWYAVVPPVLAGATADSDLLIVMESDGHYIAQHALSSEGALVRLSLPEGVMPAVVRFAGPERATFTEAHRQQPRLLSLWSGSATVRYRHRYANSLVEEESGVFSLVIPSLPEGLRIEDGSLATSSVTWILPPGTELSGFTLADEAIDGAWSHTERSLTYTQHGSEIATLAVSWRQANPATVDALCTDVTDERCVPDIDADGIPDHRDACLPRPEIETDADADARLAADEPVVAVDPFGCALAGTLPQMPLRLDDVVFPSGQSYLELTARRQLDRVAEALLRDPKAVYEIAAHTDRAGRYMHNLKLSERRASATRHYLMLRGVGPNQLRARGYGESHPLDGNPGPEAARVNRRVELLRLD